MKHIVTVGDVFKSLLIISATIGYTSCGEHVVIRDKDGSSAGSGATYYLPKTVVVVNVPIERTDKKIPDFPDYTEVLFHEKPAISVGSISFSIGDGSTIDAIGVRDDSQRFISVYTRGISKTATQTYAWNDQGVLTSGKATVENKTADFVVSTIEATAKIASSAVKPLSGESELFPNVSGLTNLCIHLNGLDPKNTHILDENGLRVGLKVYFLVEGDDVSQTLANLKGIDTLKASVENWTNFSQDHPKALTEFLRAATAYKNFKSAQFELSVASTAPAIENATKKMETALQSFHGAKEKNVTTAQFRWTPPSRDPNSNGGSLKFCQPLFVLNTLSGVGEFIVNPENPVDPKKIKEDVSGKDGKLQTVEISSNASLPVGAEQKEDNKQHGWRYRIPADSILTLKVGTQVKATKRQGIAQQGLVAFLPASASSEKFQSDIELDPTTGALKSLTQGTTAFDPGLITRAATAGSSVIEAQRSRDTADESATLNNLKQEKEELELRAAIKKAKTDAAAAEN